jgi:glycoside/pentoside/hexuronide:cation symporter, GPH family
MIRNKLSWRIKLAFGVGQWAEGAKGCAFSIFLLFYYISVQGLSGTLAGTAMLIALCFDGVSDPLMGSISDTFRSRWGRRHPFMYGAAIPFALSFFMLFFPPDNLSQVQLFIWFVVFAVLTRGFLTIYSVPHMAMNAELTSDYTERTSLSAIRGFFSVLGLLSVATGGFFYFFRPTAEFTNGQLNPSAYPFFALVFSIAMAISIWLSAIGTHSEIPNLPQAPENIQRFSLIRFFNEVKSVFQIGSFRKLFGTALLTYAIIGTTTGLAIYFYTYFWGMTSKQAGIVIIATMLGIIFSSLIARRLSNIIGGKKQTLIAGIVWFPLFYSSIIVLRLVGLLPPNGDPLIVPFVAIMIAIGAMGIGVFYIMTASMLADITDEHDLVHEVRQEGMYYAVFSLMVKTGTGLGGFFAGVITDISGLSGLTDPSAMSPLVLNRLGLILIFLPLVGAGISVFMVRHYQLDFNRHTEILQEIKLREA